MGRIDFSNSIFIEMEKKLGMVKAVFSSKICDALKVLLEEKYLYQNIKVKEDDIKGCFKKHLKDKEFKERFENELTKVKDSPLDFGFEEESGNGFGVLHKIYPPRTVNAVCETCKCETPHNPVEYKIIGGAQTKRGYDENIVLQMQCQKCKQGYLVAMVRRVGLALQLVGRNQIDMYVPAFDISYVEDGERISKLFSEAVMAERTGSHLAAICMLRVAVEQYMRSTVNGDLIRLTGDELYDKFNATLPDDFPRNRVANLKSIYARLSEVMHAPTTYKEGEFTDLFEKIMRFLDFVKLMPPSVKDEDCGERKEVCS